MFDDVRKSCRKQTEALIYLLAIASGDESTELNERASQKNYHQIHSIMSHID